MIAHQPPLTLLSGLVAGSLPPALSLIVRAHTECCPHTRFLAGELEHIGGRTLARTAPTARIDGLLERTLSRVTHDAVREHAAPSAHAPRPMAHLGRWQPGEVPPTLVPVLGRALHDREWEDIGGYFEEWRPARDFAPFRVSLIRGQHGQYVPEHGHGGNEYMLVLAGSLVSGEESFEAGAFCVQSGPTPHLPRVTSREACVSLLVLDQPLDFTGPEGASISDRFSF